MSNLGLKYNDLSITDLLSLHTYAEKKEKEHRKDYDAYNEFEDYLKYNLYKNCVISIEKELKFKINELEKNK